MEHIITAVKNWWCIIPTYGKILIVCLALLAFGVTLATIEEAKENER